MIFSKAIGHGFRTSFSQLRMVFVLYGINLIFAIPLAMAFRSALRVAFGDSMAIETILNDFDATVYSDFMKHHGSRIAAFFPQVVWVVFLYMFVNVLTVGGVLVHLNDGGSFSLSGFLENCGKFFPRMFRLFLTLAVVLLVAGVLWFMVAGGIFAAVTSDASSERTLFTWFLVTATVFLFPLMVLIMAGDYAKIAVVVNEETKVFRTYWRSVGFVVRSLFSTVAFQLTILLVLAISVVLYWLVDAEIGMTSGLTIIVMFVVQQLFVSFKVWTRVWTFSGEIEIFRSQVRSQEALEVPQPSLMSVPSPPPVSIEAQPVTTFEEKKSRKPLRRRKTVPRSKARARR